MVRQTKGVNFEKQDLLPKFGRIVFMSYFQFACEHSESINVWISKSLCRYSNDIDIWIRVSRARFSYHFERVEKFGRWEAYSFQGNLRIWKEILGIRDKPDFFACKSQKGNLTSLTGNKHFSGPVNHPHSDSLTSFFPYNYALTLHCLSFWRANTPSSGFLVTPAVPMAPWMLVKNLVHQ